MKRRKHMERPQVHTPRMQVALSTNNFVRTASQTSEAKLGDGDMWLTRVQDLPPDRLNGWVVSWIFESFLNEEFVARASQKLPLQERLRESGLASLLGPPVGTS